MKDKTTVEELTCLELARMYDKEDVTVPWDWKKQHQQQQQKDDEARDDETTRSDIRSDLHS